GKQALPRLNTPRGAGSPSPVSGPLRWQRAAGGCAPDAGRRQTELKRTLALRKSGRPVTEPPGHRTAYVAKRSVNGGTGPVGAERHGVVVVSGRLRGDQAYGLQGAGWSGIRVRMLSSAPEGAGVVGDQERSEADGDVVGVIPHVDRAEDAQRAWIDASDRIGEFARHPDRTAGHGDSSGRPRRPGRAGPPGSGGGRYAPPCRPSDR